MEITENCEELNFTFSRLNQLNKLCALSILKSLHFAQNSLLNATEDVNGITVDSETNAD